MAVFGSRGATCDEFGRIRTPGAAAPLASGEAARKGRWRPLVVGTHHQTGDEWGIGAFA